MRLGNGNGSDSSATTTRLVTLIRGARTAADGERALNANTFIEMKSRAKQKDVQELCRQRRRSLLRTRFATEKPSLKHGPDGGSGALVPAPSSSPALNYHRRTESGADSVPSGKRGEPGEEGAARWPWACAALASGRT